jgi:hypothetical protein
MSHNVRSLIKYKEDVEAEHDIKHVDLLHLTETRYTVTGQRPSGSFLFCLSGDLIFILSFVRFCACVGATDRK